MSAEIEAGCRRRVEKIADILGLLDVAIGSADVDLPGYRLHALNGDLKGFWSVTVTGNWRLVFRFEDGYVRDVDLLDQWSGSNI